MRVIAHALLVSAFALTAATASAQTADDIIEKGIAASGGRAALAKVTSRETTGTMTVTTPGGDIAGTITILNDAPNKMHTAIRMDLTAMGAGMMTIDQRFDGSTAYVTNSLQGESAATASQIDTWRNAIFPSPFLDYKERNTKIELTGKEKAGDAEAFVLLVTPAKGPASRVWIDTTTYLPIKTVATVETPEAGTVEQTMMLSDFREVDGIKVPFKYVGSNAAQTFTINVTKVAHNVKVDPARFTKPAAK